MKSWLFFVCMIFMYSASVAQEQVNVLKFGAKGDGVTDNSMAFTKAFQYCVTNKATCFIPKSDKSYVLNSTVLLLLKKDQRLTIKSNGAIIEPGDPAGFQSHLIFKLTSMFKELPLFSFGIAPATTNIRTAFVKGNNSFVSISGLILQGDKLPFANMVSPGQPIMSGLDISADNVYLDSLSFLNIEGYGVRSFGAEHLTIKNTKINNVGGRGQVPQHDAFGDGIYISVLKDGANVVIDNCQIKGAVINGRRSRGGIVFEYSNANYSADINHCTISQFAKSIHVEDNAAAKITIRDCILSQFNYGIAMVGNTRSILNVYHSTLICSPTDKVDKGDGGPIINMYHGGQINFYNSTIDLNGKKDAYITMVGVKLMKQCVIEGNNKNPFLADGNTTFDHCKFIGFGGSHFSFFAHGTTIDTFKIINSTFINGGPVDAKGQRVNLEISNSTSDKPLTPQRFISK